MTGPSDETLERLAKMLPALTDGVVTGRIGGKGTPVIRYPRFICPACMTVWGKPYRSRHPDTVPCKECKKTLTGGGVIFISMDERMVRVTPKSDGQINPDYAGKIVRISLDEMNRLSGVQAAGAGGAPLDKSGSPAGESPSTSPQSPETGPPHLSAEEPPPAS